MIPPSELPPPDDPERIVEEFEEAFRAGQRPSIEEYLRQARPEKLRTLLPELAARDLSLRIESGEAARVEYYLALFPPLGAARKDLLKTELTARRRRGEQVRIEECLERFPDLEKDPGAALGLMPVLGGRVDPSATDPGPPASVFPEADPEPTLSSELPVPPSGHGPRIPGYRVLSEIGRGGLSVAWLAEEERLGRKVVLRMRRQPSDPADRARFLQEAKALASLDHPGCCPLFAVGESEEAYFLVQPFIEGDDLDAIIRRDGPLEEVRAVSLVRALAQAVHHAHERKVIHRNLKPGAVRLNSRGEPVLTSFGVARRLEASAPRLTQSGEIMGTPSYMAPEQAAGKTREVGPLADVYGLGAILYECLTGRPPFKSESVVDTLVQVVTDKPAPPRSLRPGLGRRLEAICLKALAKDPARRQSSAKELAEELDAWLNRRPTLRGGIRQRLSEITGAVAGGLGRLGRSLWPSTPEPDPGEMQVHHVDAFFPQRPRAGRLYNLAIQLRPTDEPPLEEGRRRMAGSSPWDVPAVVESLASRRPGAPSVRLTVTVAAEHFRIEGPARLEFNVSLGGRSPLVHFRLRAERPGPGRVMIDLFQGGRPAGSLDLERPIGGDGGDEDDGGAPGDPGEALLAPGPVPGPDVILKVFEQRCSGQPGHLQFVLFSTHPALQDLPVWDGDLGGLDLRGEVQAWAEGQLRPLGDLARRPDADAEAARVLRAVGANCFDILPLALKDLSWVFRKRNIKTILILSDDPHLPWELVKPIRTNPLTGEVEEEDDFWGQSFALTHWLRGRPAVQRLSLDRVYAVAAGGTAGPPVARDMALAATPAPAPAVSGADGAEVGLPSVEAELAVLRALPGMADRVVVLPASRRQLHEAFEKGGFDLFHLACHGAFGGGLSADSSVVLMEDGPFSAAELSPYAAGPLRSASPLIFFNACHSGRTGFSLTRLGSWGARLVQLGCGGFVGALWPVTDRAAVCFARCFYRALCSGAAIGEAMRRAREQVRRDHPADPTWLAYRCFADPLARVGRRAEPS
jgi:serine/threonine protein kinase